MHDKDKSIVTMSLPLLPAMAPLLLWLIFPMGPAWAGSIPGVALNRTLNLVFLGFESLTLRAGINSAFNVAIHTIKERQLLPGYEIEFQYRDSGCNPYQGEY